MGHSDFELSHLSRIYIPIHRIPSWLPYLAGVHSALQNACTQHILGNFPLVCILCITSSSVNDLDWCLKQCVRQFPWEVENILTFRPCLLPQPTIILWVVGHLGSWTSRMFFFPEGWSSFLSPLRAAPSALSSCTYLHPLLWSPIQWPIVGWLEWAPHQRRAGRWAWLCLSGTEKKKGPNIQESLVARPSDMVDTRISITHIPWDVSRSGMRKRVLWSNKFRKCELSSSQDGRIHVLTYPRDHIRITTKF